jgi:hypothetical protein
MNLSSIEQFTRESRDGSGAGDHDVPYVFGRVPRAATPFPFSTREFARLMVLRSRARAGVACIEDGLPRADAA